MSSRSRMLVATTLSVVMVFIDQTVVGVVLPDMASDLGVSRQTADWIAVSYLLVFGSLVMVGGVMGDRHGQHRLFLLGMAAFGAGSLLVAVAPDIGLVIVGRSVQGLGAAASQPSSLALVTNAYPQDQRGRALSIYWGVAMVALVVGPVLGGLLTELGSWRGVFVINLPVIAVALVVFPWRARQAAPHAEDVDWAQLVAFAVGAGGLVVALQTLSTGQFAVAVVGAVVAGLALPVVVAHARSRPDAPIPRNLLGSSRTRFDFLSVAVVRFVLGGATVQVAVSAQTVLGYSSVEVSLLVVTMVVPMIVGDLVAGRWYDRTGVRPTNLAGLGTLAIGWVLVGVAFVPTGVWWLVAGLVLVGFGTGLETPANTDIVSGVPEAVRGRYAGATQATRQVAAAAGVAALGWLAAAYGTDWMSLVAALVVAAAAAITLVSRTATPATTTP